jgi:hypothetical protein
MAVHYPEKMRLRLPRGMPEAVALAAGQHHTTPAEWARRALLRCLQTDGVCLSHGLAVRSPSTSKNPKASEGSTSDA